MELRQLRYLVAVADERNYTRAAEKLFLSQSALSQQIQSLEKEVGSQLLDRSRQGVRLTSTGDILYRHAQRALSELDSALVAMREIEGLQRGRLRVGVVQTINAYLMPAVVSQFALTFPNIQISVEERTADQIEDGLRQGQLEVGISFLPGEPGEFDFEPLFEEELVLLVPHQHPLSSRRDITVAELDGLRVALLAPGFCTRRLWDAATASAGIQTEAMLELNTIASLLATAERARLPTILPQLALMHEAANAFAPVRLLNPTPIRQIGQLFLHGSFRCAATRAFASQVQQAVQAAQAASGAA